MTERRPKGSASPGFLRQQLTDDERRRGRGWRRRGGWCGLSDHGNAVEGFAVDGDGVSPVARSGLRHNDGNQAAAGDGAAQRDLIAADVAGDVVATDRELRAGFGVVAIGNNEGT